MRGLTGDVEKLRGGRKDSRRKPHGPPREPGKVPVLTRGQQKKLAVRLARVLTQAGSV